MKLNFLLQISPLLLTLFNTSNALKLPWQTTYYKPGDTVDLLVNTVESDESQIPYAYYDMPFVCPPSRGLRPVPLSLGEVLNGDRLWYSDYHLTFEKDEPCIRLCDRIIRKRGIESSDQLIKQNYMIEWLIDGLPGATTFIKPKNYKNEQKKYYVKGFPLGFTKDGISYLHNHVMLVIRWHKENGDDNKKTIVGFEVYPKSVSDYHCPGASKNYENFPIIPNSAEKIIVPFTYSVYWREEFDLNWSQRWSLFSIPDSVSGDGKMHWFSLINSIVLVSLLSTVAAVVFIRTLRSDLKNNSIISEKNLDSANTAAENYMPDAINKNSSGWRKLANEAFIQPNHPVILSVIAGSGVQLCFTAFGVTILMASGISGPDTAVLSTAVVLFIVAGFFAGFSSVQFYKNFTYNPKSSWVKVSLFSGTSLTGVVLSVVLIMNLIIGARVRNTSIILPFGTVVVLIAIYVLLEIPLALIGGFFGTRTNVLTSFLTTGRLRNNPNNLKIFGVKLPESTASLKPIPKQPFYNRYIYALPIFGLFPFGIIFVEMLFIFKSIWTDKLASSSHGFLLITASLLFIVIFETSIISTYLRLNSGDYRWQWKSFFIGGGSIFIYLMTYTIYYLIFKIKKVDVISPILYVVYATTLNVLVAVACGSFALVSSSWFVFSIYSSMKNE
ncbi:hypothetical protein B5S28_g970 [[Candida] boidinii]|nr:hypothetical protein B5S28_g970 [[Candida] boidinii]OWB61019.1 hypothetical protein B5S29_g1902 [[Candida] boidinii]OWB75264.1 hypothetical protein B5S31_g5139 [[Candida] boidinii]OWB77548.1 hypothetical protein B5S32_g1718 [[Candida] boidinii]